MGILTVREECVFPFKLKILFIAVIHNAQQACSCHMYSTYFGVQEKFCKVAAYRYTCTYNMLYSLSYVTEQRVYTRVGTLIVATIYLQHNRRC